MREKFKEWKESIYWVLQLPGLLAIGFIVFMAIGLQHTRRRLSKL